MCSLFQFRIKERIPGMIFLAFGWIILRLVEGNSWKFTVIYSPSALRGMKRERDTKKLLVVHKSCRRQSASMCACVCVCFLHSRVCFCTKNNNPWHQFHASMCMCGGKCTRCETFSPSGNTICDIVSWKTTTNSHMHTAGWNKDCIDLNATVLCIRNIAWQEWNLIRNAGKIEFLIWIWFCRKEKGALCEWRDKRKKTQRFFWN